MTTTQEQVDFIMGIRAGARTTSDEQWNSNSYTYVDESITGSTFIDFDLEPKTGAELRKTLERNLDVVSLFIFKDTKMIKKISDIVDPNKCITKDTLTIAKSIINHKTEGVYVQYMVRTIAWLNGQVKREASYPIIKTDDPVAQIFGLSKTEVLLIKYVLPKCRGSMIEARVIKNKIDKDDDSEEEANTESEESEDQD